MKKIIFVYIGLVVIVVLLAAWRLGAFGFIGGEGGSDAEVKAGGQTIQVEVVNNDETRATGLGGRNSLEEGKGMLFVFDKKDTVNFWMEGMLIPIDIVFIDDTRIVTVDRNVQPPGDDANKAALPLYRPDEPVNYVLEVPAGYTEKHNINVGDTVDISL